jgi:hypothetical protein
MEERRADFVQMKYRLEQGEGRKVIPLRQYGVGVDEPRRGKR